MKWILSSIKENYMTTRKWMKYWPAPPNDPQGLRVASVFEFSVCLFVCLLVCLFVLGKFSNLFLQYKAAALQKNVPRMNTDVLPSYTQNIARGPAITLNNDSRIKAVYSGRLPVRVGWYHGRGWDWLNVPIFRDYYWPARSATRVYWQQEGPMFSYSLYVVCCLYVTFLLPLERATKAGPCHLFTKWITLF